MSDLQSTIAKKRQNSDSTFKVSPFQSRGFAVQARSGESTPVTKGELWENYQQAQQLNQSRANSYSVPIQAKLTIGQSGEKYEQEADSVADRVMAMLVPTQIQREDFPKEDEELQMKPLMGTISPLEQQTKSIHCKKTLGKKDSREGTVSFSSFLNSGTGLTNRSLGPTRGLYMTNGVELKFEADRAALENYQNLQPLQWSGPESIWIKQGNFFENKWEKRLQTQGSGADNPLPQNVARQNNFIAYWDSPGPSILGHSKNSRVYVVQNFTGWIVGEPKNGGSSQRLSEVASWHSIVSLLNSNGASPGSQPDWNMIDNQSGTGWRTTEQPDSI